MRTNPVPKRSNFRISHKVDVWNDWKQQKIGNWRQTAQKSFPESQRKKSGSSKNSQIDSSETKAERRGVETIGENNFLLWIARGRINYSSPIVEGERAKIQRAKPEVIYPTKKARVMIYSFYDLLLLLSWEINDILFVIISLMLAKHPEPSFKDATHSQEEHRLLNELTHIDQRLRNRINTQNHNQEWRAWDNQE